MTDRDRRTRINHLGRPEPRTGAPLNPPRVHASTFLNETIDAFRDPERRFNKESVYGLVGTPTHYALQEAIAEIEGAADSITLSSGLAAVALSMTAFAEAGAHMLIADSVYLPSRRYCDRVLRRMGVDIEFYDPMIGADIAGLIRENTKLIFMETPGSLTFEFQDVPAIVAAAKAAGVVTVVDSSWSTPLLYRPLEQGVDVSVQAGTKYISGHGDVLIGIISSAEPHWRRIRQEVYLHGQCASPDDAYQTLRGLRTLPTRLKQHEESALEVAAWLKTRPEVARVLHPAYEDCPGHDIWRRDFTGTNGLFGVLLDRDYSEPAVAAMVEGYELFGLGASWGSFASLCIPCYPESFREHMPWPEKATLLRYHIGLDATADLIADLERGFERLHNAEEEGQ